MAVAPAPVATPVAPAPPSLAPSSPSTFYFSPQNPATSGQNDVPFPSVVALPANTSTATDASTSRKFYTITASLREIYDTNVNTSSSGNQASLETNLSPSILVDFPDANGDFSGRYTLGLTYYANLPGGHNTSSGGYNQGGLQVTHNFVAQYSHSFSERFQFNLAESFQYYTEPSILQSTGTNYQDGAYVSNILNGNFTAQWTPLWSSTFTYSNTVVRYDESSVALEQNSMENNGSASMGYALLPKITLNFGGIGDNVTYDSSDRGYTTYTGFGGITWSALPTVSVSGRAGASYIQSGQAEGQTQGQSQASIAPYAELTLSWTLGARSALNFSYEHEVTPSDQAGTNGQISDRFNSSFRYSITPRLNTYLDGVFTAASSSGALAGSNTSNLQENSYQVDTGLSYQYNSAFSFDSELTFSGVLGDSDNDNYERAEVSVGIRGTY